MDYTLAQVADETRLVVEQINGAVITSALAFQTAYIAARVEDGQKLMGDFIERLTGE
jgi:hypothetical protein